MSRSVSFFNYKALFESNRSEFVSIFEDVCSRGAYIMQRDLEEFEMEVAEFLGVKYAYGVSDGTNALILGLRALGIKEGDEVILPSHTYVASAASIYYVGAKPVLADIGEDNLLDAARVEEKVTDRTKAIMAVQVNGRTCNMDALQSVADKHGLKIVEDAAQALGAKFKGKCAGTFGEFGTISFYPAKTLGCFGDGGLVMSNDDETARQLFLMRDHGRNEEGKMVAWGTNSRLDNLQAAILKFKLKNYPNEIKRRREIAQRYNDSFKNIDSLSLPAAPGDGDSFDIYQNYELQSNERDDLREFLGKHGVGTIIQWGGTALHHIEALGLEASLPKTDDFFKKCMMLPLHQNLNDEDVEYVCSKVREFYGA